MLQQIKSNFSLQLHIHFINLYDNLEKASLMYRSLINIVYEWPNKIICPIMPKQLLIEHKIKSWMIYITIYDVTYSQHIFTYKITILILRFELWDLGLGSLATLEPGLDLEPWAWQPDDQLIAFRAWKSNTTKAVRTRWSEWLRSHCDAQLHIGRSLMGAKVMYLFQRNNEILGVSIGSYDPSFDWLQLNTIGFQIYRLKLKYNRVSLS